ncbi:MAG: hypothetical protein ACJAU9_001261, partial [Lentimonas sp.]
ALCVWNVEIRAVLRELCVHFCNLLKGGGLIEFRKCGSCDGLAVAFGFFIGCLEGNGL